VAAREEERELDRCLRWTCNAGEPLGDCFQLWDNRVRSRVGIDNVRYMPRKTGALTFTRLPAKASPQK
jgi:hypothetical protein